jgi:hypothetical protein
MEQEVWNRVQASRETAPRNDLRQLQREAMELAALTEHYYDRGYHRSEKYTL